VRGLREQGRRLEQELVAGCRATIALRSYFAAADEVYECLAVLPSPKI
jgi:hypothetical protein